jgi:hypothetical protein
VNVSHYSCQVYPLDIADIVVLRDCAQIGSETIEGFTQKNIGYRDEARAATARPTISGTIN